MNRSAKNELPFYEAPVAMYRVFYRENGELYNALFETWEAADQFSRISGGTISKWTWMTQIEI